MSKKDEKLSLILWVLLLHEFDIKVKDQKGIENQVAGHFSHHKEKAIQKLGNKLYIEDTFID